MEVNFARMSRTYLRGREFASIIEAQIALKEFVAALNADPRPFRATAFASDIDEGGRDFTAPPLHDPVSSRVACGYSR